MAELSADAQAILKYARHWGEPFTRTEIADIAPGAAWDPMSRYPRTMAKLDPVRELLRAGLIEVTEERAVQAKGRRGGHRYKMYRLVDSPRSLEELLDALEQAVATWGDLASIRAEILGRFGRR
jgi:hypothetical protein